MVRFFWVKRYNGFVIHTGAEGSLGFRAEALDLSLGRGVSMGFE